MAPGVVPIQVRDIPAIVWTSEGETAPLSVTISPFSADRGRGAPCYDKDVSPREAAALPPAHEERVPRPLLELRLLWQPPAPSAGRDCA